MTVSSGHKNPSYGFLNYTIGGVLLSLSVFTGSVHFSAPCFFIGICIVACDKQKMLFELQRAVWVRRRGSRSELVELWGSRRLAAYIEGIAVL